MPKIFSAEERAKLCTDWKVSKLPRKDFCHQNKVSLSAIDRWLKEERQATSSISRKAINFIPIGKQQSAQKNYLEMLLPNGIVLKLAMESINIAQLIKELL